MRRSLVCWYFDHSSMCVNIRRDHKVKNFAENLAVIENRVRS